MPRALITGASAGLGAEFARQLAARGGDVVLVARSEAALTELSGELRSAYDVGVEVLVADLLQDADIDRVAARLADTDVPIDVLINNAGFGLPLQFADNAIDEELSHLRIHVETPMRLMHAAVNVMRERGGRIINVASMAAFLPRSTYGASKRWLVSFSQWANIQYPNVSVTAVCPGFVHTTFHERMGLAPGEEGVAPGMWLEADDVVREALADAARGKSVSIPSLRYRVLRTLAGLVPASLRAQVGRQGRI